MGGCCSSQPPEGEWQDVYGDPVRPRRTGWECPLDALQIGAWTVIIVIMVLHYMVQIPFMGDTLLIVVVCISSVLVASVVGTKILLEQLPVEDPVVFDESIPRLEHDELGDELAPPGKNGCVFCRRFVDSDCRHCSVCDKCVPGFDHHCRWLNSCVGMKNYRLFALFMGLAWVGMAWVVAWSLYTIITALRDVDHFKALMGERAYRSSDNAFPAIMVFNFICLFLSVAGVLMLGKLIIFHIQLHRKNMSTYDHIMEKRRKKKERGEYRSQAGLPERSGPLACLGLEKRRDFKKHSGEPQANEGMPVFQTSTEIVGSTDSGRRRVSEPYSDAHNDAPFHSSRPIQVQMQM